METIFITSGYPIATVAELRRHWEVIDIRSQKQALEYLQSSAEMPSAAVIGNAMDDVGPDLNAEAMLAGILQLDPAMPVIISTRNTRPRVIVDLVRNGAFDYVIEVADRTDPEAVFAYTQNLVLALKRAVQLRLVLRENQRLKQDLAADARPLGEGVRARSPGVLPAAYLVRELQNLTEHAVFLCENAQAGLKEVGQRLHSTAAGLDSKPTARDREASAASLNWHDTMRQCERQLLTTALTRTRGNLSRAAALLGIKRTTLRYRIKQLDLAPKHR